MLTLNFEIDEISNRNLTVRMYISHIYILSEFPLNIKFVIIIHYLFDMVGHSNLYNITAIFRYTDRKLKELTK